MKITGPDRELVLEPTKRGWRLIITAPDIHGQIETSSLEGLAQILAAYGRFRLLEREAARSG